VIVSKRAEFVVHCVQQILWFKLRFRDVVTEQGFNVTRAANRFTQMYPPKPSCHWQNSDRNLGGSSRCMSRLTLTAIRRVAPRNLHYGHCERSPISGWWRALFGCDWSIEDFGGGANPHEDHGQTLRVHEPDRPRSRSGTRRSQGTCALARNPIAVAGAAATVVLLLASPTAASCGVVGDSVAVGLGAALRPCSVSARVGLSSLNAASRVRQNDGWVIVALGSNDFPRGISAAQRRLSDMNVRRALSRIEAVAGKRAIVIVPANGGRAAVESWISSHGLRSLYFSAGSDGIHPKSYRELARRIRALMAD
jgi:hypothetical protein